MVEVKLLPRKMSLKHKAILCFLLIAGITIVTASETSCMMAVKSILLYTVLLIASYTDYRFRVIPDWIHIIIILIGFIHFNPLKAGIGLILPPIPFLIMALVKKGSIGGGDIKLVGAMGFTVGYFETIISSMIGLFLAVLLCGLYYYSEKKAGNQSFPFAPFLSIGYTIIVVMGASIC